MNMGKSSALPEPANILKEVEKDIASRKREFLYSLIRRDHAQALVEYVKKSEACRDHRPCDATNECATCEELEAARAKLGLNSEKD
jgi:hypothetical protein